ncbi:ESCRT-I subunit Mvb12 [Nakaseomyces glabratus]|nr:ESCRT-I subunit Mvb12 [Nakaseomyces glabratus]
MSDNQLKNIDDILNNIPLRNKFGDNYPRERLNKVEVPLYKIENIADSKKMFEPWYKECDEIIAACEVHDQLGRNFEQWYNEKYISTKPPGMVQGNGEISVLSPSKKHGEMLK